jgi:predicted nucleotidyltransferase
MREPWAGLVEAAAEDPDVIAILLHGSTARGDAAARDVDVAVVLDPDARIQPAEAAFRYAEHSSGKRHEGLDVSVFQALPLYIRQRILAEHRILWVRDERAHDALYDVAWRTVKEWETFRPHYQAYLEEVARG